MGKYATVMYDFSSNKWQHLANLPNIELAYNTQSCHLISPISLTVFITKSGKKYMIPILRKKKQLKTNLSGTYLPP